MAGVVEGDEVNAVAGPVVPGLDGRSAVAVDLALRFDFRTSEKAGEFGDVALAGHGRNRFVIAAAKENRQRAEGSHLVLEEVVPGAVLVLPVGFLASRGQHCLHVLIWKSDPAEVAEVPVEEIALCFHFCSDGGHDEVAAVAAVSADGEGPWARSGLCQRGKSAEDEQGKRSQRPEHPSSIAGRVGGRRDFTSRWARRDSEQSWVPLVRAQEWMLLAAWRWMEWVSPARRQVQWERQPMEAFRPTALALAPGLQPGPATGSRELPEGLASARWPGGPEGTGGGSRPPGGRQLAGFR